MMKKYIFTMLLALAGLGLMAQTNETLPGDAVPLTNQLYLSPADSTVWAADPFGGLSIKVGTWQKVDSLFKLGYTKVQVDSVLSKYLLPQSEENRFRFDGWSRLYPDSSDRHVSDGQVVKLGDGTLVNVFRIGAPGYHVNNDGAIYASISLDSGKTYGAPVLVYDDPAVNDMNISAGPNGSGGVAVMFSKYNYPTARVGLYATTSSDGVSWAIPTEVAGSSESTIPFGKILHRGGDELAVLTYSNAETKLWTSDDGGDTWEMDGVVFTNASLGIMAVEPFLIDLPNGKSLILARNNSGSATTASIYQFTSNNGTSFTYDGATNINNDIGTSAMSPVYIDTLGSKLIVFAPRRMQPSSSTLDIKNVYADMNIYVSDIDGLTTTSYELKHTIRRPKGDYLSFYGYPFGVNMGDFIAGVIVDRWFRNPTGSTSNEVNEQAGLYAWRYSLLEDSKDVAAGTSAYGGNVVKNRFNNGFDYVITDNDKYGYINTWPQNLFASPVTGQVVGYNGTRWTNIDYTVGDKVWTGLQTFNRNALAKAVFKSQSAGGLSNMIEFRDAMDAQTGFVGHASGSTEAMYLRMNGAFPILFQTNGNNTRAQVDANGITAIQYRLSSLNTAPVSASATGTTGEIRITATHIYVCIATNTWVRAALTTW